MANYHHKATMHSPGLPADKTKYTNMVLRVLLPKQNDEGQSRLSIVSLIIFFVVGIFMLSKVNVEKGIRAAEEEENEMIQA